VAVSSSSLAQLTRKGVNPIEAGLQPNSKFKRLYGIPPKGTPPKGGWPDSAYGFPVPPSTHPQALKYARAVLSRAHQSKNYSAADLKKQIKKAQAIVKKHDKNYKPSKSASSMAKGAKESRRSAAQVIQEGVATPQAAQPPKPVALRESLHFTGQLRESSVDLEKGTARVIVLRTGPGNAADKHYYTPECLEDAVERKVFEAAQNYVDHPTELEDKIIPERMVEKLGGWFCDVEMGKCENEQGITVPCIEATFVIEPGNELVLNKLRAAQQYAKQFDGKPYLGFSINASGVGAPAEIDGQEFNRVDRITEVISVDLVTRAGAGGKLLQLKESARKAEAVKQGLKTNLVRSLKGAIKEAGIGLSQEQDEALDKALGIEDGGALDNLLDQVTLGSAGGAPTEDETESREDGLDGAGDGDEQDDAAAGADDASGDGDGAGDDDEDGDDDIDEMDESALKAALRAARKKEREAKKHEAEAKREAQRARRESQKAKIATQGVLREREMNRVLDKLKPPAAHRPRMIREMRQAEKLSEMESIAREYMEAFLGGTGAVPGAKSESVATFKLDCLAD
jgi:hypothetical protein